MSTKEQELLRLFKGEKQDLIIKLESEKSLAQQQYAEDKAALVKR